MVDCPSCGREKDFVKEGKFICSNCNTKFTIDKNGNTAIYLNKTPIITISIIVICTIIFALSFKNLNNIVGQYGIIPNGGYTQSYFDINDFSIENIKNGKNLKTYEIEAPKTSTFYRAFTYIFLHGNIGHLFFNMLILGIFGTFIEQKMKSKRFIIFFLLVGYLSGLAISFFTKQPTIGASGAIFGLLISFAWFYPHQEIQFRLFMALPSQFLVPILIGVEVIYLLANSNDGISHEGHLAGIAVSLILLFIMFNNERKLFKSRPKQY